MNKKSIIITILAVVLTFVFAAVLVFSGDSSPKTSSDKPGQEVAVLNREHIKPGESHPPYNSLPPTSGWHYASTFDWGISDKPIADELQIHNLEHGGVIVQYKPDIDKDTLDQLKNIVFGYKSKVILAPYPKLDNKIAITAWGRIDKFDQFDKDRIVKFIETYKNKGPENVPD